MKSFKIMVALVSFILAPQEPITPEGTNLSISITDLLETNYFAIGIFGFLMNTPPTLNMTCKSISNMCCAYVIATTVQKTIDYINDQASMDSASGQIARNFCKYWPDPGLMIYTFIKSFTDIDPNCKDPHFKLYKSLLNPAHRSEIRKIVHNIFKGIRSVRIVSGNSQHDQNMGTNSDLLKRLEYKQKTQEKKAELNKRLKNKLEQHRTSLNTNAQEQYHIAHQGLMTTLYMNQLFNLLTGDKLIESTNITGDSTEALIKRVLHSLAR